MEIWTLWSFESKLKVFSILAGMSSWRCVGMHLCVTAEWIYPDNGSQGLFVFWTCAVIPNCQPLLLCWLFRSVLFYKNRSQVNASEGLTLGSNVTSCVFTLQKEGQTVQCKGCKKSFLLSVVTPPCTVSVHTGGNGGAARHDPTEH